MTQENNDVDMRLEAIDWDALRLHLHEEGSAVMKGILSAEHCAVLRLAYKDVEKFRSRVVMERYHFGRGEYQYWRYPLPAVVQQLREAVYPQLVPVANAWMQQLNREHRFPPTLSAFLKECHMAEQQRPTPLLLRYRTGDYNCLHQDLYGDVHFPLQMIVALSQPGDDYDGGELVLVEQRPRQQSRPRVITLQRGDAVVIAVNERPEPGVRGYRRVQQRHGVSTIRQGERYTLGIIFHDAR